MNARSVTQKKRREREFVAQHPKPWPKCACGCGQEVNLMEGRRRPLSRYIHNHHRLKSAEPYRVDESGCWLWLRAVAGGYGTMQHNGRVQKAHPVYYENAKGAISGEHEIHHRCEQTLCVNPDHLEAVTRSEHRQRHLSDERPTSEGGDIAWVA